MKNLVSVLALIAVLGLSVSAEAKHRYRVVHLEFDTIHVNKSVTNTKGTKVAKHKSKKHKRVQVARRSTKHGKMVAQNSTRRTALE